MITEETVRVYNKTLEPNLWDENKTLHPEIRLDLLKIAKDFYESTDFKSQIIDILLLGSSINYTWTPESDIDIHIVIDINKEGIDPEHYRKFLDSLGGKWNQEHDITIKGHKAEIYIQDITEKNSTPEKARKHGAMFSLLNNKWLVPPLYEKPSLDKETIKKEFHTIKNKIDVIIKDRNIDGLKDLMKSIRDYRNKGLEGDKGEFSTENIVFKALRHTGMLEKLKDAINSIYDRMVTIKENEEYLKGITQTESSVFDDVIEETFKIIEEQNKPYILVGAVDSKLYVTSIPQEHQMNNLGASIAPCQNSGDLFARKILYSKDRKIDSSTAINWRYRSDVNELLWCDWPSEKQSHSTKEYLKNSYGITNPRDDHNQYASQRNISEHHTEYQYKRPQFEEISTFYGRE